MTPGMTLSIVFGLRTLNNGKINAIEKLPKNYPSEKNGKGTLLGKLKTRDRLTNLPSPRMDQRECTRNTNAVAISA